MVPILLSIAAQPMTTPVNQKDAPPITAVSRMATSMEWIGKAVDEPDYYVWCTSPIQGPDGKIHLFCSRWPKALGMGGWMTHSEVAHYVGASPEGPFRFQEVALKANPGSKWMNSIHNPAIFQVGKTFVLLFITFDFRTESPWMGGENVGGAKMLTCMATAPFLSGPWTLKGDQGLIVKPSPDPSHWTHNPWSMDNPTFLHDAKAKKFYVYFKASSTQRKSRYGFAVSDRLEGPYRLSPKPITDNIDYIEDATAFSYRGRYYLLTNDNYGTHTGVPGRGILWSSPSPEQFKLSDAQIGFFHTKDYMKGVDVSKARPLYGDQFKFERPGILLLNGKPAHFYGPSGVNLSGDDRTFSYVMQIKDF